LKGGEEAVRGDELALDYKAFYNTQALKLIDWMYAEKNTTKRAKLYRTACRIEHRFRRYHGISENRPWKTGSCVHLPTSASTTAYKDNAK